MALTFSLVGGLLIAVVLQLVFADLAIALGLSLLDLSPGQSALKSLHKTESKETESGEVESGEVEGNELKTSELETSGTKDEVGVSKSDFSLPVTHLLGFGVALSLSLVIFVGTLLSVELSGLLEPRRGVVFGLVFWSAYWLLFIWLCSTTITEIADSLVGGAIASGRKLISTVKQSLTVDSESENVSSIGVEQATIQELLERVSELTDREQEIPNLLDTQQDRLLSQINTIVAEQLADQEPDEFEPTVAEQSAAQGPDEFEPTQPKHGIAEVTTETEHSIPSEATVLPSSSGLLAELPSWQQIARSVINQVDLSDWDVETLLDQIPTDTPKPSTVASQIKGAVTTLLPEALNAEALNDSEEIALSSKSVAEASVESSVDESAKLKSIQIKIENYCRYTSLSALTPEKISEKVRSQLQEHSLLETETSDAERVVLKGRLDIDSIEAVLSRRQNLTEENKQQLTKALQLAWPPVSPVSGSPVSGSPVLEQKANAQQVTNTRPVVQDNISDVEDDFLVLSGSAAREAYESVYQAAYQKIEEYFQSIDWETVSLEDIKPEVNNLLNQLETEGSLSSIDWSALTSRVQIHHDIREELTDWLQATLTSKLQSVRPLAIHTAQELSEYFTGQIADYLKNQEKPNLQPGKVARELSAMVSGAIAALPHPSQLTALLSTDISFDQILWNKDRWKQILESRQDMTAAEIEQILDWGEQIWHPKAEQIADWLQAAQFKVSQYLSLPDLSLPNTKLLVNASKQATKQASKEVSEQITQRVSEQAAIVQETFSEQVAAVREDVQTQIVAVKEDIQMQVDSGRRQVAIAAWWLFIAFVSSGSAAAGAGWLATVY